MSLKERVEQGNAYKGGFIRSIQNKVLCYILDSQYLKTRLEVNFKGKAFMIDYVPLHLTRNTNVQYFTLEELKQFYDNHSTNEIKRMAECANYPCRFIVYTNDKILMELDYIDDLSKDIDIIMLANVILECIENNLK